MVLESWDEPGHNHEVWKLEWDALSIRIAGIIEPSTSLFQTAPAGESDGAYSTNILFENYAETVQTVQAMLRYGDALPPQAKEELAVPEGTTLSNVKYKVVPLVLKKKSPSRSVPQPMSDYFVG